MNKRSLIIFGILIAVISGAVFVIVSNLNKSEVQIQKPGDVPIVVSVLPKNAEIKIRGTDTKLVNNQTNYLAEGDYTVSITAKDYDTQELSIEVKKGLRPKVIAALSVLGDKDMSYGERDLKNLEKLSYAASNEYTEAYDKKYPAKKLLPYIDPYYKIGYKSTDGVDFIITVHTESPRYREMALKKIISMGINPSEYKIVFNDYVLPIGAAQ